MTSRAEAGRVNRTVPAAQRELELPKAVSGKQAHVGCGGPPRGMLLSSRSGCLSLDERGRAIQEVGVNRLTGFGPAVVVVAACAFGSAGSARAGTVVLSA